MIDYEILLMLDPELSEEQQGVVVGRTRELIEQSGGSVDRHDAWGRRKLAYEIDKKGEGNYHLLLFSCSAETLEEVSRVLKIDDTVMRHMATRRPHGGSADVGLSHAGPPESAPPEPVPQRPGPSKPVAVAAPTREDVSDDVVAPAEPVESGDVELADAEPAVEPAEEEE